MRTHYTSDTDNRSFVLIFFIDTAGEIANMPTFFQAGLIIGIQQGVYEGDVDFKRLEQHGDTGLGTLNGVDGEMIAIDNDFYHIDSAGAIKKIDPVTLTPFSIVTKFNPTLSFMIAKITSLDELTILLDTHIPTPNIFYMMRIDAELDWIKIDGENCKMRPAKPLIPRSSEFTHLAGSLIVTRCPDYSAAFTIPGYHYHFIDSTKTRGGHVADLKIKTASVKMTFMRRFSMVLFNNKSFNSMELSSTPREISQPIYQK